MGYSLYIRAAHLECGWPPEGPFHLDLVVRVEDAVFRPRSGNQVRYHSSHWRGLIEGPLPWVQSFFTPFSLCSTGNGGHAEDTHRAQHQSYSPREANEFDVFPPPYVPPLSQEPLQAAGHPARDRGGPAQATHRHRAARDHGSPCPPCGGSQMWQETNLFTVGWAVHYQRLTQLRFSECCVLG